MTWLTRVLQGGRVRSVRGGVSLRGPIRLSWRRAVAVLHIPAPSLRGQGGLTVPPAWPRPCGGCSGPPINAGARIALS